MGDVEYFAVLGGTFLLAGLVKGVIGMGLPTVSLALLTVYAGLPEAMALLLAPSFVTNVWQGMSGGHGVTLLRRCWPFFLTATVTVWVGGQFMVRTDVTLLSALLGILLIGYGGLNLAGFRASITGRQEKWSAPLLGTANGILTGMTGSFVVPGVMYLQAIGLPRDMLIQAMGILFTVSTVALGLTLGGNGMLNTDLGWGSLTGVVPALIGMEIGKKVRHGLSEARFRQIFFVSVVVVGGFIVVRALT